MYILVADGMLELAVHAVEQLLHGVVPEVTSEVHYKYIYIYIYICVLEAADAAENENLHEYTCVNPLCKSPRRKGKRRAPHFNLPTSEVHKYGHVTTGRSVET